MPFLVLAWRLLQPGPLVIRRSRQISHFRCSLCISAPVKAAGGRSQLRSEELVAGDAEVADLGRGDSHRQVLPHKDLTRSGYLAESHIPMAAPNGRMPVADRAGSAATVPPLVNFSGELTPAPGGPATGMVGMTFLLYKDPQGGVPLWMETQNVHTLLPPDIHPKYSACLRTITSWSRRPWFATFGIRTFSRSALEAVWHHRQFLPEAQGSGRLGPG
jgi:hypothetical protein